MGSPALAPVVVRELWHARGALHPEDLEGLVSILALGGLATLRSEGYNAHIPRSTALSVGARLESPVIPAAAAVQWRGTQETRTRTVLVLIAGEGRWWRGAAPPGILEAPRDNSSDEGLPEVHLEDSETSSEGGLLIGGLE